MLETLWFEAMRDILMELMTIKVVMRKFHKADTKNLLIYGFNDLPKY